MRIVCAAIVSVVTAFGQAQDTPKSPAMRIHRGISEVVEPSALDEMGFFASLIVEGVVEADSAKRRGSGVETDFRIAVTRVLKGSADTKELTVWQFGGALDDDEYIIRSHPLLQRGERYVLFVRSDPQTHLPNGVNRPLEHALVWGIFNVRDGKVYRHIDPPSRPEYDTPSRREFDGMSLADFEAAIEKALLTPP